MVHSKLAALDEKWPAGHASQLSIEIEVALCLALPKRPAAQSVHTLLLRALHVPSEHLPEHSAVLEPPLPKVPAGHPTHATLPGCA